METARGSPLPEHFPSSPGMVYPLYHVLADVGELAGSAGDAGGVTLPVTSSNPLRVEGLALRNGDATAILLANLGPRRQRVRLLAPDLGATVLVRALDETAFEAATRSPETFRTEPSRSVEVSGGSLELDLLPYAVVRVDVRAWSAGEGREMCHPERSKGSPGLTTPAALRASTPPRHTRPGCITSPAVHYSLSTLPRSHALRSHAPTSTQP